MMCLGPNYKNRGFTAIRSIANIRVGWDEEAYKVVQYNATIAFLLATVL